MKHKHAHAVSDRADQLWEREFAKLPSEVAAATAMLLLAKSLAIPSKDYGTLHEILTRTISTLVGLTMVEFAEKERGRRNEH